jgi:hypothetical protein
MNDEKIKAKEAAAFEAAREALGLRAVASKHWRWMPGMLGLSRVRGIWIRIVDPPMDDITDCFPDFTDPATRGCLLHLVREVGKTPDVSALRSSFRDGSVVWSIPVDTRLVVELGLPDGHIRGSTEAEALVAALEILP